MSDLYRYFDDNPGRLIHKWGHYFSIYERHFSAFRNRPIRLIEYGVFHGGSLQMWKHYFGPQAQIIGVDIDPRCAALAEPGIEIVIGDQDDPETHQRLREKFGDFDIVIDDGGHTMHQQIVTFKEMYPAVKAGGIYLAEDLHTSYFPRWGGGLRKPGTFIEYSKLFIDQMHAWYSVSEDHQPDLLTTSAYGLHFYDSILVIEKGVVERPFQLITGIPSFQIDALEYLLLAEHDQRKGNLHAAIEKCRAALQARPESPDARIMLDRLQVELAARGA
ncbi:MAG: class I SAM-dependent methyltransferase [Betaproteobacteria bacterium]